MPRQSGKCSPEEILASFSAQERMLAERLCQLTREVIPDAVETGYRGWRLISIQHHGLCIAIYRSAEGIKLAFEHGAKLSDPEALLQGAGRQMRHVLVRTAEDIRMRPLKRLVQAAKEANEQRAAAKELKASSRGAGKAGKGQSC